MKSLKTALEDIIMSTNFMPSNCIGTRTTNGDFATPQLGPQKINKKNKWKLKKTAKVNDMTKGVLGVIQRRPTPFKIEPAQWQLNKQDIYSDWQKDAFKEVEERLKGK